MEFRNINEALPVLCNFILTEGEELVSRLGERVMEKTGVQVVLSKPWERELLMLRRKASLPAQIAETMWVLARRNDVAWLENYLPRAKEFSDDGLVWRGAYGPRLRDQLNFVLTELRENPTSRRAVVAIYDADEDMGVESKDIPCNVFLQFLSRLGKLEMHVTIRSNDLIWGWSGINAFEWSSLQEIMAHMLGLEPGSLVFNIGSLHIYDRHWNRAQAIADGKGARYPAWKESPRYAGPKEMHEFDELVQEWFRVEEMLRTRPDVEIELDDFPEPMLRSWLRVIAWWWSGNESYLDPLLGTPPYVAALKSPGRSTKKPWATPALDDKRKVFLDEVKELHRDKDAVYGDSWRRRGEMLGILANIARKVDRLGKDGAGDTELDTRIDLLVYLAKYRLWLIDNGEDKRNHPFPSGELCSGSSHHLHVNTMLDLIAEADADLPVTVVDLEYLLRSNLSWLEVLARDDMARADVAENMSQYAYRLAWQQWSRNDWRLKNETRSWKGYGA